MSSRNVQIFGFLHVTSYNFLYALVNTYNNILAFFQKGFMFLFTVFAEEINMCTFYLKTKFIVDNYKMNSHIADGLFLNLLVSVAHLCVPV